LEAESGLVCWLWVVSCVSPWLSLTYVRVVIVTLPYVDISMLTPLMDEVVVACPPDRNNNDARGRAIYVEVIADTGGGTIHACSSSSRKLMIRVSAVHHDLQDVVPPQML
jgi:hypothetical protein